MKNSRKKIYKLERESNVQKCEYPGCTAWVIENTENCEITLISILEKLVPLVEKPEFYTVVVLPGEKKLLPHVHFTIHSMKGGGKFIAHTAPIGSDFIYEKKKQIII